MKHEKKSLDKKPAGAVPAANSDAGESGIDFAPCPDEVARHVYFTYLNQGAPLGCHVQHWLDAEAELIRERNLTRTHGFPNHNQPQRNQP